MNHMQSLKFENKLYASVKHKMEEMQQHNMSWIEVSFDRNNKFCFKNLLVSYFLTKTSNSVNIIM